MFDPPGTAFAQETGCEEAFQQRGQEAQTARELDYRTRASSFSGIIHSHRDVHDRELGTCARHWG